MNQTCFIVEVKILHPLGNTLKSKILGVWKDLDAVPVARIRELNERAYPNRGVRINIQPYNPLLGPI